jgi:NAD(P)-dependent dehydrogenase (short-subunit alcohol dehydrogenase family)
MRSEGEAMGALKAKTIVITGGSLGIGLETAVKAAAAGARVILAARNEADLKKALAAVSRISRNDHQIYPLDVSRYDAVQTFAKWCAHRFGTIDGLVNCAGIYGPIGKFSQIDIKKFDEAIGINLLGTVYMCHSLIPVMTSSVLKKIVNYSGGGAATPFPHYMAYATSKIAIVRFTENLALELNGEGFDVNCVAPGFVITRLHQDTLAAGPGRCPPAFYENTKRQMETGGVPAEKAANLTVYLLSEDSKGITGKFISAPWDAWEDEAFRERLRSDKDFATLRRIDDKTFFERH